MFKILGSFSLTRIEHKTSNFIAQVQILERAISNKYYLNLCIIIMVTYMYKKFSLYAL